MATQKTKLGRWANGYIERQRRRQVLTKGVTNMRRASAASMLALAASAACHAPMPEGANPEHFKKAKQAAVKVLQDKMINMLRAVRYSKPA